MNCHASLHRAFGILVVVLASRTGAQQAQVVPDASMIPLSASDLVAAGMDGLKGASTVLVPAVMVHVSVSGAMKVSDTRVRGTAIANTEYFVTGLRKSDLEEAALVLELELVARLRAAGLTVLRYEDVKDRAALNGVVRLAADTVFGLPITKNATIKTTFATITASDDQSRAWDLRTPPPALSDLARQTGAVIVIPELWFLAPQMEGAKAGSFTNPTAKVQMRSGMDLFEASLTLVMPSGSTASMRLKKPVTGLADAVGDLELVSEETVYFGAAAVGALQLVSGASLARTSSSPGSRISKGSFVLTVNPGQYSSALLIGGASFLRVAAEALLKARK